MFFFYRRAICVSTTDNRWGKTRKHKSNTLRQVLESSTHGDLVYILVRDRLAMVFEEFRLVSTLLVSCNRQTVLLIA